jgi:DNA-binding FadR family transcriptional regulator
MLIAQRIVHDVLRERRKPGDMLPPEREMLDTYAAGRATLRESLRLLEFQGVIAIKPGSGGGPVLLEPDASHLASTLVLLMQLKHAPLRTIIEVRSAIEPMISALAVGQIGPEGMRALAATISDMQHCVEDERVFLEANKRFHDIMSRSSGNPLFGYIIESVLDIMDGVSVGIDYPLRRRSAILRAHERIYDALLASDRTAAEELMRAHIMEYQLYLERHFPESLDRVIQWSGR